MTLLVNSKKPSLVDVLFPTVRKKVLGLLFGNPGRSFFLNELVKLAKSGNGAVQRELERLSERGLVLTSRVGNQKHYQANPDSPIFDELSALIKKTVGLAEPLRDALRSSCRKIHLAFVYGSIAKETDHASSDIDLLIVSDEMTLEDVFILLSNVEAELSRRISPTLYTKAEFDERLLTGSSFLTRVLRQAPILLIGELPNGY